MTDTIEVFADVLRPFAHVGRRKLVERRAVLDRCDFAPTGANVAARVRQRRAPRSATGRQTSPRLGRTPRLTYSRDSIRRASRPANHGIVTMGDTPDKALHNAELTERTAMIVWGARALGTPVPLPGKTNENMAGVYRLLRGI